MRGLRLSGTEVELGEQISARGKMKMNSRRGSDRTRPGPPMLRAALWPGSDRGTHTSQIVWGGDRCIPRSINRYARARKNDGEQGRDAGGRTGVITAGSWLAAASWKVYPGQRRVSVQGWLIPLDIRAHARDVGNIRPLRSIQGQCRLCTPPCGSMGIGAVLVKRAAGRRWLDRAYQEGEYLSHGEREC